MRRAVLLATAAVLALLIFAGVASAAAPAENQVCLGCHSVTADSSSKTVDFRAPVSLAKCKACHSMSPDSGIHDKSVYMPLCSQCHGRTDANAAWLGQYYDPVAGRFASSASLMTSPEELHRIHGDADWVTGGDFSSQWCKNCHLAAACDACHDAPSSHGDHVLAQSAVASYAPVPSQVCTGAAGAVTIESTFNYGTRPVSCYAAACHPKAALAAGADLPACTNCHKPLDQHYAADTHVSSWAMDGCIASGCHDSRDLVVEHEARRPGEGCTLCHGNTSDPRYAAAISAGDTACGACHDATGGDAHRAIHWAEPPLVDATGPHYGYYTGSASTAPTSDCIMCHTSNLIDEHMGTSNGVVTRLPRYASDGTPLSCDSCHKSSKLEVLDAIATGKTNCEACHPVHAPISTAHRSAFTPSGDQGCSGCHAASLVDAHEGVTATTPSGKQLNGCDVCHSNYEGERGQEVQFAIEVANDTRCTACHASYHAGAAAKHTADDEASVDGCSSCHGTAGQPLDVTVVHKDAALGGCKVCHANPTRVPDITAKTAACASCHSAEGTDYHRGLPEAHTFSAMSSSCIGSRCHAANTLPEAHEPYLSRYPQYATTCALCHQNADPARIDWSQASSDCSSCHTVHGDIAAIHTAPDSQECVDCHETADVRDIHGASQEASCDYCHNAQVTLPASTKCANCHGALSPVDPNHYPAAAHDASAESGCGQCHYKDMKAEHFKPTVGVTCVQCHELKVDAFTAPWDKTCGACHPVKHAERQTKHQSTNTACAGTGCHDITKVDAIHAGLPQGGCSACHKGPNQPATTTDCTVCHAGVGPNHHEAHDASGANPSGCKGCHFTYLDDEHAALGYTCQTCHGSTNATVQAAIAAGDRRCLTCHPDSPHNARQAWEFTPKMSSGHRVSSDLPGMQSSFSVNGKTYTWTLPAASSFLKSGWSTDSVMSCDSCHTYTGASGPHGAAMKVNIDPAYPTSWKSAYLTNSSTGMSSTTVICAKCHDLNGTSNTWSNKVHEKGDHQGSNRGKCILCHAQVPHGWKRPRLLAYTTDGSPYASTGLTGLMLKSYTPTQWSKDDCSTSCGEHKSSVTPVWPLVLDPTAPTTGDVAGTVTDSSTGAPVAGATVSVAGKSATTGSDGKYSITGVTGGTYTLTVTATGYQSWSSSVTVVNGSTVTLNAALTPTSTGGGSNLALGKTFTASRYESSSYVPAKAGDGSESTYWWSKRDGWASDTEWLTVDLASRYSVSRVEVAWYGDYWAKEFRVYVSTDNRNWTQVYSTTSAVKGTTTVTFSARDARYVRVECRRTGTGRNNGYGIAELRVFQ